MELPPGVILASPDEPDTLTAAPLAQSRSVDSLDSAGSVGFAGSASAPESMVQPEAFSPPAPSFEDLALLPAEESQPADDEPATGSSPVPATSPKDLSDFFEKHQLELIATGSKHSGPPSQASSSVEAAPFHPSLEMPTEWLDPVPGLDPLSPPQGTDLSSGHASTQAFLLAPEETETPGLSPYFEGPSVDLNAPFSAFPVSSPEALQDPMLDAMPSALPNTLETRPLPPVETPVHVPVTVDDAVDDPAAGIYPLTGIFAPVAPEPATSPEDWFAFDSFLKPSGADDALMSTVNTFPASVQAASFPEAEGWDAESSADHSAENLVQHSEAFFLYPTPEAQSAGQTDSPPLSANPFNPWEPADAMSPVDLWMAQGMAQASDAVSLPGGQDEFRLPILPDSVPPNAVPSEGFASAMDDLQLGPEILGSPESPVSLFDTPPEVVAPSLPDDLGLPLPDGLSLDDETFDLDRILLGTADPAELPGQPGLPPEMPPSEISPSVVLADSVEPSDADILEHYFGDEAQGLKGHDNLDSYDFGHYEDPDAPAEAFVLDEAPQPAAAFLDNLSYDQYYTEPESELSFRANLWASEEQDSDGQNSDDRDSMEEQATKALPDNSYASFLLDSDLLGSGSSDDTAGPDGWPPSDMESGTSMEPTDLADRESPTTAASPEPQVTAESQPEPAKPSPEKLVPENMAELALLLESRIASELAKETVLPHSESISDAIDTFSQDVLLHSNRFLGRSIDRLVDAYFTQRNQNNA
ncbi:hypothetical protein [Vampirovibrio chlorellavorus]|uniref:hypothetical protein n=1 Tax=Vampirovibrio chlorellavorus TaxID=758823 RepID=UPI0026F2C07D|nr:hypothetical protein [Vampirovibrio chlorellavorus]